MDILRKTPAASIRWLSPAELSESRLATGALDAAAPILAGGLNGLNSRAGDPPAPDIVKERVSAPLAVPTRAGAMTLEATFAYRRGGGVVGASVAGRDEDGKPVADPSPDGWTLTLTPKAGEPERWSAGGRSQAEALIPRGLFCALARGGTLTRRRPGRLRTASRRSRRRRSARTPSERSRPRPALEPVWRRFSVRPKRFQRVAGRFRVELAACILHVYNLFIWRSPRLWRARGSRRTPGIVARFCGRTEHDIGGHGIERVIRQHEDESARREPSAHIHAEPAATHRPATAQATTPAAERAATRSATTSTSARPMQCAISFCVLASTGPSITPGSEAPIPEPRRALPLALILRPPLLLQRTALRFTARRFRRASLRR